MGAAAEALLIGDSAQPHLSQPPEEITGELMLLFVARRGGRGPPCHKLPDGADDVPLLVGDPEVAVHGAEA